MSVIFDCVGSLVVEYIMCEMLRSKNRFLHRQMLCKLGKHIFGFVQIDVVPLYGRLEAKKYELSLLQRKKVILYKADGFLDIWNNYCKDTLS